MSSTNRGHKKQVGTYERQAEDFYATPAWATDAIIPVLWGSHFGGVWLDPCAGAGAILDVLERHGVPSERRRGIEIDPGRAGTARGRHVGVTQADALKSSSWGLGARQPNIILTNPPYALAMEFVERALQEAPVVVMLLRLAWMASQARADFHQKHPSDVYVLSKRPSFVGGRADSADYAWFVWGQGGGRWRVL